MFKTMSYKMPDDFAAVSLIGTVSLIVVVREDSPFQTLGDYIDEARARGGMMFGSPTIGGTQHFTAEYLIQVADIPIRHIPYGNTPNALAALQSGEVPLLFETVPAVLGQDRKSKRLNSSH